jgi:Glucose / Sorbosone dehydrogenase
MDATSKSTLRLVLLLLTLGVSSALPEGFIAEVVSSENAISGTFAPNPRSNGKPMLLLGSKEGQVSVVENPDESPDATLILDLKDEMCHDTERGLQNIAVHPDFAVNRFIYLFYNKFKEGCLADDSEDGPWNVVARFVMDPDTLQLDYDTREEIWRYVRPIVIP